MIRTLCRALPLALIGALWAEQVLARTQSGSNDVTPQPDIAGRSSVVRDNVLMTRPIGTQEIEFWSRILNLHEAQRQAFDRFYEEFLREDQAIRERELPALMEEAAAIPAAGGWTASPENAQRFIDMISRRNEVVALLQENENQFLGRVRSILGDTQLESHARIESLRNRIRCQASTYEYPGSRVDLSVLLWSAGLLAEFRPSKPDLFDRTLREYEHHVTPLFVRHFDAVLVAVMNAPRSVTNSLPTPSTDDEEAMQKLLAKQQRNSKAMLETTRAYCDLGRQIHDLNARFAPRLATMLPEPHASQFLAKFREAAYPSAYPNPYEVGPLFTAALVVPSVNQEQREALEAHSALYRTRVDDISSKMVNRYVSYKEEFFTHRTFDAAAQQQFRDDMTAMQADRKKAADYALENIQAVLTASQWDEISAAVRSYKILASVHKSRQLGMDFRP